MLTLAADLQSTATTLADLVPGVPGQQPLAARAEPSSTGSEQARFLTVGNEVIAATNLNCLLHGGHVLLITDPSDRTKGKSRMALDQYARADWNRHHVLVGDE
jgi:hypothetical protein